MIRTRRCLTALVASCSALLAFASVASAQQVLYGADGAQGNPSNLYLLNPASGAATQTVGPIGFAVTGLAVDPSTGTLYGVTGFMDTTAPGHLITVNKTTGAGTLVGDLLPATDDPVADITFTPDATLFGWSESTDDLVTINKATGAATVVGSSGIGTSGSGLASNAAGVLYLAPQGDDGDLFTVDRSTGAATTVATLTGTTGDQINALAFDAAGTLFGSRLDNLGGSGDPTPRPTALITINTSSGAVNVLGPSVNRLDAIVFSPKVGRSANLKKKFKKGRVRLSGHVDAPGNEAACEVGQTVQLQRKKPKGGKFGNFRKLKTNTAGDFSTKVKVKKTFTYRAFVPETSLCDDVTSKKQKVKKKK